MSSNKIGVKRLCCVNWLFFFLSFFFLKSSIDKKCKIWNTDIFRILNRDFSNFLIDLKVHILEFRIRRHQANFSFQTQWALRKLMPSWKSCHRAPDSASKRGLLDRWAVLLLFPTPTYYMYEIGAFNEFLLLRVDETSMFVFLKKQAARNEIFWNLQKWVCIILFSFYVFELKY